MRTIHINPILTKEREGGYSVEIPELDGCFTQGENLDEAAANAKEAARAYIKGLSPELLQDLLEELSEEKERTIVPLSLDIQE